MESLYLYSAGIGGFLFLLQLGLSVLGIDGMEDTDLPDLDTEFDADGVSGNDAWFVGIVSFRSLVAAFTVFGLVGLAAEPHLSPVRTFVISFASGAGVLYLVGWMFRELGKLNSDGTVHTQHTIGCTGTVYLRIPANKSEAGKVIIEVKSRTMEYAAVTQGEALPNGTAIVVTAVLTPDTIEVAPIVAQTETNTGNTV